MSEIPNETPETANNDDIHAGAIARRRIDAKAIATIAKLCAKQLTEAEACRRLGIEPRAWFNFKHRAKRGEKFKALVESFRAQRIEHLIERIEKSADGIDTKYPDFRAALALLKIADRQRFGDSPTVEINTGNQSALIVSAGGEAAVLKMLDAIFEQRQIAKQAAPKQIADAETTPGA